MNENVINALKHLSQINEGRLTPEAVVNAARDAANPLHEFFTWDNDDAAHKHRLHEARQLIKSVRVDILLSSQIISAPYYVRDPSIKANEQGYIATPVLRNNEDAAREAIVAAFKRASNVLNGAREVALVLGMVGEISSIQNQIVALAALAEKPERRQ